MRGTGPPSHLESLRRRLLAGRRGVHTEHGLACIPRPPAPFSLAISPPDTFFPPALRVQLLPRARGQGRLQEAVQEARTDGQVVQEEERMLQGLRLRRRLEPRSPRLNDKEFSSYRVLLWPPLKPPPKFILCGTCVAQRAPLFFQFSPARFFLAPGVGVSFAPSFCFFSFPSSVSVFSPSCQRAYAAGACLVPPPIPYTCVHAPPRL